MSKFTSLPMNRNETVREFCQRIEIAADEAQTIILNKLKDETKKEPTVQDIFELMKMDAVVRQMQAHHKYREDYNTIVNSIDDCVNLEMLSAKASKVADRRVNTDELSEPRAYLNAKSDTKPTTDPTIAAMGKQMEKMMALIAQGQNDKTSSTSLKDGKQNKKGRSRKDQSSWTDPDFRARVANFDCRVYKNRNECDRTNCPYLPCNKKSASKTYYSKDF